VVSSGSIFTPRFTSFATRSTTLNEREILEAGKLQALLVGAVAPPAVLIALASGFEWVPYPPLTQSSPPLEIQLIAAAVLGETLVRVCSRAKPEMLSG